MSEQRWILRHALHGHELEEPDRPVVSIGPTVPRQQTVEVAPVTELQSLEERLREKLLVRIADEGAVSKAEDTYRAVKRAADDPWDDTGWAEPMSEALMAGLEAAFDELAALGEMDR